MHRLDRISAKKPAKLLDSKSLTLSFSRQQIWPVFLLQPSMCANPRLAESLAASNRFDPGTSVPVQHENAEFGIGSEFGYPDRIATRDVFGIPRRVCPAPKPHIWAAVRSL